ncbi:MAG: hypothetical protein CML68_18520 [Rhodobacteraceae bacterium]|nr:hypothetical protein [Paracoccaceae bacterium]
MKILLLLLLAIAGPVMAQDSLPHITAELSAETTVIGQPMVLRVKVLVPTFISAPPVIPDLEMPGLPIRLPERATGPTSERVDGERCSGATGFIRRPRHRDLAGRVGAGDLFDRRGQHV